MLDLSAITLLCVETRDPALAHFTIQKCTKQASFGKVVLITDLAKLSNRINDQTSNQTEDKSDCISVMHVSFAPEGILIIFH